MKHLRYFDALARHSHFGRAAEACAISQPALSVQVKELESLIGAPLVERSARRVQLTPLGQQFAARGAEILRSVEDLQGLVRTDAAAVAGPLRLGVIPTVAPYLLPQLIPELGQRFPELQIEPREAVTQSLIAKLLDHKLDAAIVALPISEPDLREFALFEEEFVLVREVAEAKAPVPSPIQLKNMRLLLLEEGHCFRDQALSFCEMSAQGPRDLMEGSSLTTLVQMVGSGIGLTLIPEMSVPLETARAQVTVARFPAPAPSRSVGMVWRKSNPMHAGLMEIGGTVRRAGTQARDRARGQRLGA